MPQRDPSGLGRPRASPPWQARTIVTFSRVHGCIMEQRCYTPGCTCKTRTATCSQGGEGPRGSTTAPSPTPRHRRRHLQAGKIQRWPPSSLQEVGWSSVVPTQRETKKERKRIVTG